MQSSVRQTQAFSKRIDSTWEWFKKIYGTAELYVLEVLVKGNELPRATDN
jgi:hypothetical protein